MMADMGQNPIAETNGFTTEHLFNPIFDMGQKRTHFSNLGSNGVHRNEPKPTFQSQILLTNNIIDATRMTQQRDKPHNRPRFPSTARPLKPVDFRTSHKAHYFAYLL